MDNKDSGPDGAAFSDLYAQSFGLVQWSPDGTTLAAAKDNRLTIRDAETMQILQIFSCLDTIEYIEWNADGEYILAAIYKKGLLQVWSINDSSWTCKINEGVCGMAAARWCPDGRQILTVADFNVHISVWSLLDGTTAYLRNPKFSSSAIAFSNNGRFLAVAERVDCKDYVTIYHCESWETVRRFPVETYDLVDFVWSVDDRELCLRDSVLEYAILFYSLEGSLLARYQAYEQGLGVKSMALSPSGQFLAVGSYDEKLRFFNNLNWRLMAELGHGTPYLSNSAIVFKEVDADEAEQEEKLMRKRELLMRGETLNKEGEPEHEDSASHSTVKTRGKVLSLASLGTGPIERFPEEISYLTGTLPIPMPILTPDPSKPNPRLGVGTLLWSADSKFVVTRNDNMPNTLWMWQMETLELYSVLVQLAPIKAARWDPVENRLAVAIGGKRLYLWSTKGASWIDLPVEGTTLDIRGLRWSPTGKSIILVGKQEFCCCYLPTTADD